MKLKTLLLSTALISPFLVKSQSEVTDTIKVIDNARSVSVTRTGDKTVVKVTRMPDEDDKFMDVYTYEVEVDKSGKDNTFNPEDITFKLPFVKETSRQKDTFRRQRYLVGIKYFYWGWNFNYDHKDGTRNSFEVGVADLVGVDWRMSRKTTLGIGLGFGFNRVTTRDYRLFAKTGDALSIVNAPQDADVDFARLDSWRFHVPLMYTQRLCHDFGFAFATIVNFNTYSKASNRYTIGNTRYTETIKGLNQRLLTVDFMATVGIVDEIGAYIKWSPVTAMQAVNGPSYRNFSIGVNLCF